MPSFNYENTGNFDAVVVPQNVGFEQGEGPTIPNIIVTLQRNILIQIIILIYIYSDLTAAGK